MHPLNGTFDGISNGVGVQPEYCGFFFIHIDPYLRLALDEVVFKINQAGNIFDLLTNFCGQITQDRKISSGDFQVHGSARRWAHAFLLHPDLSPLYFRFQLRPDLVHCLTGRPGPLVVILEFQHYITDMSP